jgi:hypothetical protein
LYKLQTECPDYGEKFFFGLPQLSSQPHIAKLRMSLHGYTWTTHDIVVKINGHDLGRIVWDNPVRKDSEFTFPSAWLKPTDNVLRLENGNCPPPPPPPNDAYFSHYSVEHQAGYEAISETEGKEYLDFWGEAGNRQYELQGFSPANLVLYDITDPTKPTALIGAEWTSNLFKFQDYAGQPKHYLAASSSLVRHAAVKADKPSDLGLTSARPDYLLIGYGPFLAATQPLVELREAQGLDVMVVDVEDIYDEFSYGLLHPEAIRDFLHHAAAAWSPRPAYVLLVGDGTVDYRDHKGLGWRNYLPAFPADVDLHAGPVPAEAASDRRLDPGPELPIFQIGRLPVSSVVQTQAVVGKIVGYETAPSPGFWNRSALIITDGHNDAGPVSDYAEELYQKVAEPLRAERVYLASNPSQPHEYSSKDPAGREAARAAIRRLFADGQLLVTYMGHSSHSQWAQEILLHRDDVPTLRNGDPPRGGRLPVVLSMTCYTGAFQFPSYSPLDERLLLEPQGGAVATWGATGSAVASGHRHLAQGFVEAVQAPGTVTLGDAVYAGLLRLHAQAPASHELLDTYALLGDPAMRLNRFEGTIYNEYLPLVQKGW